MIVSLYTHEVNMIGKEREDQQRRGYSSIDLGCLLIKWQTMQNTSLITCFQKTVGTLSYSTWKTKSKG